jgi:formate dehydrogenase subunit gamma
VSLVIIFITFLRDNCRSAATCAGCCASAACSARRGEPPSHRFNAGEKVVFWGGVLLLGIVVVGSGLVMDKLVPNLVYDRQTMQVAHMVHAVSTVLMMVVFIGHIYIGTIGMRGAYTAMRRGYVDEPGPRSTTPTGTTTSRPGKIPAQRSKPLEIVDGRTRPSARLRR